MPNLPNTPSEADDELLRILAETAAEAPYTDPEEDIRRLLEQTATEAEEAAVQQLLKDTARFVDDDETIERVKEMSREEASWEEEKMLWKAMDESWRAYTRKEDVEEEDEDEIGEGMPGEFVEDEEAGSGKGKGKGGA